MCNEGGNMKIRILEYVDLRDMMCESGLIYGLEMWGLRGWEISYEVRNRFYN
jgi:hypothetical protein